MPLGGSPSVRNINSLWKEHTDQYKARVDAGIVEAPAPTGTLPVGFSTQLMYHKMEQRHISSVVGSSLPRHAADQFPPALERGRFSEASLSHDIRELQRRSRANW